VVLAINSNVKFLSFLKLFVELDSAVLVGKSPITGLSITRLMDETIPNEAICICASGSRVIAPLINGISNDIKIQLNASGSQYIKIVL
jgi:hypothetical protein